MLTIEEFYQWERASRDTIDVKRCYIDLAGDLVTGILLSQIIFWHLPGEKGSKLRVEREGRMWLAKSRSDWWKECRISPKQFDRSSALLIDKGLIETKGFHFQRLRTIHIWLNLEAVVQGVTYILTKGEDVNVPEVDKQIDQRVKSKSPKGKDVITETTSENTSKTTPENKKAEPSPVDLIFKAIHAFYGYPEKVKQDPIPNYGKEGNAIKKMIGRGFSPEQIITVWAEKVKNRDGWVSMVWVNEDIAGAPALMEEAVESKYKNQKYGHLVANK